MDEENDSLWDEIIPTNEMPNQVRPKARPLYGGEVPVVTEVSYEDSIQEVLAPEETYEEQVEELPNNLQSISEVERRLEKANLYRQWASGGLYDNQTSTTVEVEQEFKDFALKQLNKLIGITTEEEKVVSPFNEIEITVLKELANTIINNHKLKQGNQPAKPIRKPKEVIKQEKPVIKPVAQAKPRLKPKTLPVEVMSVRKPVPEVVVPPSVPSVVLSSAKKPQVQAPPSTPLLNQTKDPKKPLFGKNGEIIKENGKEYEIVWNQINTFSYGRAESAKLERMKPKSLLMVGDMTIYKTEGDELYSIIKRDKTPKTMPVNAIPMPSIGAMEGITLSRASKSNASSTNILAQKMGGRK
jgi:hypothetical protein